MYRLFESLSEAKRARIIEASVREFGRHGYERASTDEIVKAAGISKGILYHYFGTKKKLYLYIFDYVAAFLRQKLDEFAAEGAEHSDIMTRLWHRRKEKTKVMAQNLGMYRFIYNAMLNPPPELTGEIRDRLARIRGDNESKYFQNIDKSQFRDDVDPQRAIKLIILVIEAYTDKFMEDHLGQSGSQALEDLEHAFDEMHEYLRMLKRGLYKD